MTKILLIEDNHDLGALFQAKARARGLALEVFESLGDLGSVGRLGSFDVAVLDFCLGSVNGIEISEYVTRFFKDVPVILISAHHIDELPQQHKWPASIRRFVSKDQGVDRILDAALAAAGGGDPIDAAIKPPFMPEERGEWPSTTEPRPS